MLDPTTLFTYEREIDSRSLDATTLIVTLGAFADSGNVQQLFGEHLGATSESRLIGTFDTDQIIDYTGSRPPITLSGDTFEGYVPPQIALTEYVRPGQRSFLVLSGPEPNFQWERCAHAIRILVEQLGITRTMIAGSFPAATPHTRPTVITRYASNPKELVLPQPFPAAIDMRATFTSLLTLRLGEAGHIVIGLAAQVPSYAHELDFYPAVPALITAIETEGGPSIDVTDALLDHVIEAKEKLDQASAENEQLSGLIKGFEENFAKLDGMQQEHSPASNKIPGAEHLSEEVEQFLRDFSDGSEDGAPGL